MLPAELMGLNEKKFKQFNNLLKKAVSLIRELLRFILKKLERG